MAYIRPRYALKELTKDSAPAKAEESRPVVQQPVVQQSVQAAPAKNAQVKKPQVSAQMQEAMNMAQDLKAKRL